jgi:hypothetical protein
MGQGDQNGGSEDGMTGWRALLLCLSMIFSENRFPPRIKSGAGFFGIML